MVKYFALNPSLALTFKNVSQRSEVISKQVCHSNAKKRHKDDEVDAVRHLVWSALLGHELGAEKALILTSLQEDIKKVKLNPLKMDLYNNSLGITYGQQLRSTRWQRLGRRNVESMITRFALRILDSGEAYVIGAEKPQSSNCERLRLYPNY